MLGTLKYWINPKDYIKTSEGTTKLSKWAKKIYKQNNYQCLACGYRAGGNIRLEAHHIVPKSINPKLAYRLSNGVTLCSKCHRTDDDAYHAVCGIKGSVELFEKWLSYKTKKDVKEKIYIDNNTIFIIVVLVIITGVYIGVKI